MFGIFNDESASYEEMEALETFDTWDEAMQAWHERYQEDEYAEVHEIEGRD